MPFRIAFAGLRHGHITGLYKRVGNSPDFTIAGTYEKDPAGLKNAEAWGIPVTHSSYEALLAETHADIIAVGDCYGNRGQLLIRALETGHHVIADKPLCTSLAELDRIRMLAEKNHLCVGEMLDFRTHRNVLAVREAAQPGGPLGKIFSISFTGRHPLNRNTRPAWYFEPGMHGGTLNDIAIHAMDAVEFITGSRITSLEGARCWNARVPEAPHFKDGGMCLFSLENGCTVMGDVSYFGIESLSTPDPFYWRFELCGEGGIARFNYTSEQVLLYRHGSGTPEALPAPANCPDYLDIFLSELKGGCEAWGTRHLLDVTETTLKLQAMADGNL